MRPLADPLAPLVAARAGGFGLGIAAKTPPPGAPGWRPAHAAAADPELLEALINRAAAGAGTGLLAVAATWHLEKHAWYVSGAALAAILIHGALPPLDRVLVKDGAHGFVEGVALPRASWRPADGAALGEALAEHLEPLVRALCRHRAARGLWRSAGDRLAQAALWCGEAFGERDAAWRLAEHALAAPTALQAPAGFTLRDGVPFRRRDGCCLTRRCPGGTTCEDCPLLRG